MHQDGSLDARGVQVTAELLARILAAAPRDSHNRPAFSEVDLRHATFPDQAVLDRTRFKGTADFTGATFEHGVELNQATFDGPAWFRDTRFQDRAELDRVTFHDQVEFNRVTFERPADFTAATFQQKADFRQATFQGAAWFSQATFRAAAWFGGVTFQDRATFGKATFRDPAWFDWAAFHDRAGFGEVTFEQSVTFEDAVFEQARQLGPLLVRELLVLDGATFQQRVRVRAAAGTICARRARFADGVQLQLRWAQVVLDDADLAASSSLAAVPPFPGADETEFAEDWQQRLPPPRARSRQRRRQAKQGQDRPRLLSVRRADVAGLTLSGVDLRACRFAGARHLDLLRIEGQPRFAPAPAGWGQTNRQTLAEEHHWRHHRGATRWHPTECQLPTRTGPEARTGPEDQTDLGLEPAEVPDPAEVAALYRALRKGREDNKDEPGAADFYYGEMSMRRHASRLAADQAWQDRAFGHWATSSSEHLILTLYWLVSGYGLRAWRALATLTMVLLVAAVGFAFWGFAAPAPPDGRAARADPGTPSAGVPVGGQLPSARPAGLAELPAAVRFSVRSATALLRGPERPLTPVGEWLEIFVRLSGPVLLGLAILSVRGRVKR